MQPLFLKPVFKERIWGGTALRNEFGYDIPVDKTGECWAISAHSNGPSIVENGPYAGLPLNQLWQERPELFGHPQEEGFPLLTKILDANTNLSVQVHPDNQYARIIENGELGKTECWYILDCREDAEIIIGHHANTKEEFIEHIHAGNWDSLLKKVKIKPGDFFYIPSGTIHAICEGTLILETQQSSDTTYRVYDYDRQDDAGNVRELHLDKAIDVTVVPSPHTGVNPKITMKENITITTYVESEFFSVHKWEVSGEASLVLDDKYLLLSVIKGNGTLKCNGQSYPLIKGRHLILPVGLGEFMLDGELELIVSHP